MVLLTDVGFSFLFSSSFSPQQIELACNVDCRKKATTICADYIV